MLPRGRVFVRRRKSYTSVFVVEAVTAQAYCPPAVLQCRVAACVSNFSALVIEHFPAPCTSVEHSYVRASRSAAVHQHRHKDSRPGGVATPREVVWFWNFTILLKVCEGVTPLPLKKRYEFTYYFRKIYALA